MALGFLKADDGGGNDNHAWVFVPAVDGMEWHRYYLGEPAVARWLKTYIGSSMPGVNAQHLQEMLERDYGNDEALLRTLIIIAKIATAARDPAKVPFWAIRNGTGQAITFGAGPDDVKIVYWRKVARFVVYAAQ